MNQRILQICLAGFVLYALAGCGMKTDPVPPGAVIPATIDDLTYRLDEKGVTLSWTYPPLSVQGTAIDNIRQFKIFKAEKKEADFCPECPLNYDVVYELNASRLKPGKRIKFSDPDLKGNYHFFYMVQSHSGWNIYSNDSNSVNFIWHAPLNAPADLRAEAGDRLVTLSWTAPRTLTDGTLVAELIRYQLSRSINGKKFKKFTPIIEKDSFTDGSVKNDVDYYYKVRGFYKVGSTIYPGLSSEMIHVHPIDTTPPAPPRQVRCVRTVADVKIFWENSPEKDIRAYRIYRRPAPESRAELIGQTSGAAHMFVDQNPPTDADSWYYSVTAVDNAPNPNESASSSEAIIYRRRN